MDMTLLMPVNMAFVNMVCPLLNNKTLKESIDIFKKKVPGIVQMGWCYWGPVSVILFTVIQCSAIRFYTSNVFALFWQMNLAYTLNMTKNDTKQPESPSKRRLSEKNYLKIFNKKFLTELKL